MSRVVIISLAVTAAAFAILYQGIVSPTLVFLGASGGRPIDHLNVDKCLAHPALGLQACDKMVLHEPSGLLYLACSTPEGRINWAPGLMHLNASGKSTSDYVAIYDPSTSKVQHLTISGLDDPRGLSVHGMDVVPSASNSSELFVYLVNHRVPNGQKAEDFGADSSVEIFKTTVGGSVLTHLHTVSSILVATPNDVLGAADGKSFYATNDHGDTKTGLFRSSGLPHILNWPWSQATYCHVDDGCKVALPGLKYPNGIARGKDGKIWISDAVCDELYVTEVQPSNTILIKEVLHMDRSLDNLAIDGEGNLWAAAYPDAWTLSGQTKQLPLVAPSSVFRVSLNGTWDTKLPTDKWTIEKMFDDDGQVASASTSAVFDTQRKRLYLHGLLAPHLTICEL